MYQKHSIMFCIWRLYPYRSEVIGSLDLLPFLLISTPIYHASTDKHTSCLLCFATGPVSIKFSYPGYLRQHRYTVVIGTLVEMKLISLREMRWTKHRKAISSHWQQAFSQGKTWLSPLLTWCCPRLKTQSSFYDEDGGMEESSSSKHIKALKRNAYVN